MNVSKQLILGLALSVSVLAQAAPEPPVLRSCGDSLDNVPPQAKDLKLAVSALARGEKKNSPAMALEQILLRAERLSGLEIVIELEDFVRRMQSPDTLTLGLRHRLATAAERIRARLREVKAVLPPPDTSRDYFAVILAEARTAKTHLDAGRSESGLWRRVLTPHLFFLTAEDFRVLADLSAQEPELAAFSQHCLLIEQDARRASRGQR